MEIVSVNKYQNTYLVALDSKGKVIRIDDPDIRIRESAKRCCHCGELMHYVHEHILFDGTRVTDCFRHRRENPNCMPDKSNGAGETQYHEDLKKLLLEKTQMHIDNRLPLFAELICDECGTLYKKELLRQDIVRAEKERKWIYQPDVSIIDSNDNIYMVYEVVVTHSPEPDYKKYLKDNNIKLLQFEINIEEPFEYWVNKYIDKDGILHPSSVSFIDFCDKKCKICGNHLHAAVMRIFKLRSYGKIVRRILYSFPVIYYNSDKIIGPERFTQDEIEFAKSKGVQFDWNYSMLRLSGILSDYHFTIRNDLKGTYYDDFPISVCSNHRQIKIISQDTWAFYSIKNGNEIALPPLNWQGGDQLSDVKNILEFIIDSDNGENSKTNILIYESKCGSGKSSSILHVAKECGRTIIVAPFKNLQRQYYDDYYKGDKFVKKADGSKLNVAVILGRSNFKCRWLQESYEQEREKPPKPSNISPKDDIEKEEGYFQDKDIMDMYKKDNSCANRKLPCTRSLGKRQRRWTVASQCKYWTMTPMPISVVDKWKNNMEEDWEGCESTLDTIKNTIKCSKIEKYESVGGMEYCVFIRDEFDKDGNPCPEACEYYKQFYHYPTADVIVMNTAKWDLETRMGRKPLVSLEAMDEGDYWLDNQYKDISINRKSIDRTFFSKEDKKEDEKLVEMREKTLESFDDTFNEIKYLIECKKTENIKDTDTIVDAKEYEDLFEQIRNCYQLYSEKLEDDEKYRGKLTILDTILKYIDIAYIECEEKEVKSKQIDRKIFIERSMKVYIPYPNLILKDLFNNSSKNIILMSGTVHSNDVLSRLFGIDNTKYNFKMLKGRTDQPGNFIYRGPSENKLLDVKFLRWTYDYKFRSEYNNLVNSLVDRAKELVDYKTKNPGKGKVLIQTPGKKYALENKELIERNDIHIDFANYNISDEDGDTEGDDSKDEKDLNGDVLRTDKQVILSTRMTRGTDLRDDLCRCIIILKYPLTDIKSGNAQALKRRFGDYMFWNIKRDKARRECIQMVGRGLRHNDDWVIFTSPDINCTKIVRSTFDIKYSEEKKRLIKLEKRKEIYGK